MIPKRTPQSGFFSPRFLTGFAFCAIGVFLAMLIFARPNKPVGQQTHSVAQQNIPTFNAVALPAPKDAITSKGTTRPVEGDYLIDMAALDIHPAAAPLPIRALAVGNAGSQEGAAMDTGKAFRGITHEVANASTTAAFGVLTSGWIAGESVQVYLNGVLATTLAANAEGVLAIGISTGAGFGYVTAEEIGLTSGKDTGGVVQVANTSPYLPGVTGAPHAINPTPGTAHFYLYGFQYPVSSSVPLYRNGVLQTTVLTNGSGRFFVTYSPAKNGDTSAVYSADTVNPSGGVTAGVSLEERADAGTPPVGDQNAAWVFFDHATLNSGTGGDAVVVGKGFEPDETVTFSGCVSTTVTADAEGAVAGVLRCGAGAGVSQCVLTGETSGRVARGTILLDPDVTKLRGLRSFPPSVTRAPAPGNMIPILATKLPANATGALTPTPTPTPTCPLPQAYNYMVTTGSYLAGTTNAGVNCNDCSVSIAFPFSVKIYDNTFTSALAGSNGELAFGTDFSSSGITCMPVDSATYTIGPFWVDQSPVTSDCPTCGVFYATYGTAPNRTFVIEWRNTYFSFPRGTTPTLKYEVIFNEATALTGRFDVSYNLVSSHSGGTDSALTVGVQKDTTNFTQVGCDPTGTNPPAGVTTGAYFIYTLACPTPTPTPTCNYTTTTGTGAIVPGTTDTGNHCDDCTTGITFPFPVTLYGQAFTSANVSSNGNLQFTGDTFYLGTSCPLPDPNLGEAILPYQDDLLTDQSSADCTNFASGCGIFTSVTGTAPNRQFNIEWRAGYFGRSGTANFEVVFYEGQSSFFDVFYGVTADNGSSEDSGVQRSATGPATTFSCLAPSLNNELKVTYTCTGCAPNDYTITTTAGTVVPGTLDTGNHCDDCTTNIAFPFPVTFYDETFTAANLSSNGNLQFTSNDSEFSNDCLPAVALNDLLAPYWDDLYTGDIATGQGIFTSVPGTAPNR